MNIDLVKYEYLISDKLMPCDALSMWFDLKLDVKLKEKGINIWVNAWKGIKSGEKYIHYEFADTSTGEIFEMNVRPDMNKMMIKYKLYHHTILTAFSTYKLNQLKAQ